jgi:HSP20 family protein
MVRNIGPAGIERIELKRLTERVGRLFSVLQEASQEQTPTLVGAWVPPVDVCETAAAVWVRIELPGVVANQIRIGLNGDKLRVYGEKKKRNPRHRVVSHLCSERSYGHFNRILPLRWVISVKDARAELSDGVLVINLPKAKDRRGSEFKVPIVDLES